MHVSTKELGFFPKAMTIAGSDSGGGAGIQADLKTFSANGVYGSSVVTAVTAQNTLGVHDVFELPSSLIESQIRAVMSDIGCDVIKTGMLSSSTVVETVVRTLNDFELPSLVIDPVMKAKGGASLISEEAIETVKKILIPMASIVTPNIPEAIELTGIDINDINSAKKAALYLVNIGADSVVIKGGHLDGPEAQDLYYDGDVFEIFSSERFDTKNTHGTGCTFASAIAAGLAKGLTMLRSVSDAKDYVSMAIKNNRNIGSGHGPINHFYKYWGEY
tara:strand:- start:9 stop:833 length:825 start_codon:yes stop_codon:yes gene_type:complete